MALESLLDQKGKTYTRETLARQAILVDVLTGVISPLDDGDLVISIFALNKTAKLYGIDLLGANVSWNDLKAVVLGTATVGSPRVIAHIKGNHFVIVTAITDIIQSVCVAGGILGLSIWGIGKVVRPVFPQLAGLTQNYIGDLMIGIAVVFVAAQVVEGLAGALGGA